MAAAGNDSNEDSENKRTCFPCLATARYTVAAVVSVLTIIVVVMVTIVALRPEKVIFSITYQPIEAWPPWWDVNPVQSTTSAAVSPSIGSSSTAKTTTTTHSAVKNNVSFYVSLTADNPSGRADVFGDNVTIRVLDMPYYYESPSFSFQTLTKIVEDKMQDHFSLSRQTSHTLLKWILVHDAAVLSYLADRYNASTSFTAMVQVTAYMEGKSKPQVYYCWPVIVGQLSSSGYDRTTFCRPEKEMDYNVSFSGPPSAPPPPPVPVPAQPAPEPTSDAHY